MKYLLILVSVALFSCTAAKVAVPENVQQASTSMKVTGVNGWMVNQELQFGPYTTSTVKRGWDFASIWQGSRISFKPEDQLLKLFDLQMDNKSNTEKNRLQFTISNGTEKAAVFALEKFRENQVVYRSKNEAWGTLARTTGLQYAFSAAILLTNAQSSEPWQLVMTHKENKTAEIEELGYLSNGDLHFDIQPLRLSTYTNSKGKSVKVLGGGTFAGYEIKIDGGIVGVVDVLDNRVWIVNELDPAYKMVLAATASSLLLKRKQDITNN